jgi:hypothetical protein
LGKSRPTRIQKELFPRLHIPSPGEDYLMRAFTNKTWAMAAYLALVSSLFIVVVDLSSHVATRAVAIALPLFPYTGPRPPSRVELRELEIAQFRPHHDRTVTVLTVPAGSPQFLAAQLDETEIFDLAAEPPGRQPARKVSRRSAPAVTLSAGEEFGKRFGVLTMASR